MVVPLAQKSGEICTGQVILQPILLKPDRLLVPTMPCMHSTGKINMPAKYLSRVVIAGLLWLLFAGVLPASAQTANPTHPGAKPDNAACQTCHGSGKGDLTARLEQLTRSSHVMLFMKVRLEAVPYFEQPLRCANCICHIYPCQEH